MVRNAKQGLYSEDVLEAVPLDLRRAWFVRADEPRKWRAKPELQSLIAFRELNLIAEWPMKGQFDIVFCRNVVIYFDEATQERIWTRFAAQMNDNACLYIGHSERVMGAAAPLFVSDGMTTYRKRASR
jgi:chemotaxis protein methyltransferase CheR